MDVTVKAVPDDGWRLTHVRIASSHTGGSRRARSGSTTPNTQPLDPYTTFTRRPVRSLVVRANQLLVARENSQLELHVRACRTRRLR